ncbi:MAG: HAD-IB family hydrolase [Acidimicrobiia bacterium]|nr:HAD-IB family hydrolase [Acidimicrobiia bacterium]
MADAAAFFDLDKTVIAKSSTLAFRRPMHKAGMLGRRTLLKAGIGQLVYVLFGADHDQMEKVRTALVDLSEGWRRDEIEDLVEEALEDIVAPLVFAEALFLIDDHVREGRRVVIVSASPVEIVRPLAHYIGVDEVVATRSLVDEEGRFTGELEFYAYGQGKADEIERIAERDGISLQDSYAYSDSVTDLPMMEVVGHPVAVNPDKELRQEAENRGWPVLEFQRQVSLRARLTRPVPLISGATLAAGAAAVAAAAIVRSRRRRG